MIEAHYWWEEAAKLKELAQLLENSAQQVELLELAETCESVAIDSEDRATGG